MIRHPIQSGSSSKRPSGIAVPGFIWVAFLVISLLLLDIDPVVWTIVVTSSAVVLAVVLSSGGPRWHPSVDVRDLFAVGVFYLVVVGLFRVAFAVTPNRPLGFWLAFTLGLLIGVLGPFLQQIWGRKRGLSSLGISRHHLSEALTLGLILALVQFAGTLWGYRFAELVDWVPLVAISVVIGFFEVVFFRGFVQTRLEASIGTGPGVAGAAVLYSLYHWAYGVGLEDLWLLFGLGIVYGIAYRLVENIFVLWPLVTPLNVFFNLEAVDIDMPWAAVAGFAVMGILMGGFVWWAHRHTRRRFDPVAPATRHWDPSASD